MHVLRIFVSQLRVVVYDREVTKADCRHRRHSQIDGVTNVPAEALPEVDVSDGKPGYHLCQWDEPVGQEMPEPRHCNADKETCTGPIPPSCRDSL